MPDSLHWDTVTPLLKDALTILMESEIFDPFRLVGGTSLSLQLGHRMSDDIDLFTDEVYESIDFDKIDKFLRDSFAYVSEPTTGPIGMGRSYFIGNSKDDTVKLDLYYTDKFIRDPLVLGPYRLATVEEIVAMKIDIVQRRGRKKDFWDLHEVIEDYSIEAMIALHQERYPYNHNEAIIRENFTDFSNADGDFDPKCARGKFWELIKYDFFKTLES
ncbi:nucleotidyl transferase AbiEii/AbiGii toxin family protein [Chryseolinea soli]|uniref:Nucleotidyl transferase AbiEii/AbiGii toxin family protein n=1 Tax=Chryseolinea soli TaxID=2321403 RepID=A0A385SL57_9BACT|nr:nucleotidyl transferase AbiEii/AbiGii toxin family protein [Chryseolinea soli]AYB31979.1 nucleotidyl transferase AbiEii/AbiGii toxin family protein [Chryseolinea soli]